MAYEGAEEARILRHRSKSIASMGISSEGPGFNRNYEWRKGEDLSGDSNMPSMGQAPSSHHFPSRPLIEYCTNEWRQGTTWKSQCPTCPDQFEDTPEPVLARCLAVLKARKIRRFFLLYTTIFLFSCWLWSTAVWPSWKEQWKEQRMLTCSVSMEHRAMSGGLFGSNHRPTFSDMIQVKDLDPKYIPKIRVPEHSAPDNVNRLIFIGDVHGCLDELKALLEKVEFDAKLDHLITTGDLIAKGPDSPGVVDLVRRMGASCVRGIHEDRILLTRHDMETPLIGADPQAKNRSHSLDGPFSSLSPSSDQALAASLSADQISYLETCPVILRVGFMQPLASDLVVVHAGLSPGVPLERQEPTAVMSMRSIDLRTHVPSRISDLEGGVHWIKFWEKYQSSLSSKFSSPASDLDARKANRRHTTVIYGHAAKQRLQLKRWSKGIDTGCVKGGKLTALILSDGGSMQTVQVKCKDYRKQ